MTRYALCLLLACSGVTFASQALAQPDPATVIKMCDDNGDNAVTAKEWAACGAPESYPQAADKNGDGKITVGELKAWQATHTEPEATPKSDSNSSSSY